MIKKNLSVAGILKHGDLLMTFGLFGVVMMMIMPVAAGFLDSVLAISIGLSLLILLVILYVKDPSDFSGFPTLLLFITLFRLALNISSTRLILLDGYAGQIIETFGNFVVRGNYVVGLVVFAILVIINFIVITKGAGRIAEVAARFTLDAMPGKQMSVDAELNAGIITEAEAKTRRRKVEQESDFYGAMDGASKFVRGDAIASVLITLINIVGGFAIGMFQKGLSVTESLERFTLLSVGDGLVSQIPALITSVAAGILVTRAASKDELGKELGRQLILFPKAMAILTVMLVIMALVPGMPMIPFMVLAGITGYIAWALRDENVLAQATGELASNDSDKTAKSGQPGEKAEGEKKGSAGEKLEPLLNLDPFQIELGYGLVSLADKRKGGDLLERVTGVRKTFAQEMGIIVPPIRLRDNLQLEANHYRFLLKGNTVAEGTLMPGHWLAMNATNSKTQLKGVPTTEPVFKLPATWITDIERKTAEISGYTVVDTASVLITHLSETVKRNSHEILSRQDVQNLLDNLKTTHPTLVTELVPGLLNVGQVQRVLQNLLAEGLSIRNLAGILEKVGDYASISKNPDELSEYARKALGMQIVKHYVDESNNLRVITLDPELEQQISQGIRQTQMEISLLMEPKIAQHVMGVLSRKIQQLVAEGLPPIVVCGPQLRLPFRRFFETTFADLAVLSYAEIPAKVEIQTSATIPMPG